MACSRRVEPLRLIPWSGPLVALDRVKVWAVPARSWTRPSWRTGTSPTPVTVSASGRASGERVKPGLPPAWQLGPGLCYWVGACMLWEGASGGARSRPVGFQVCWPRGLGVQHQVPVSVLTFSDSPALSLRSGAPCRWVSLVCSALLPPLLSRVSRPLLMTVLSVFQIVSNKSIPRERPREVALSSSLTCGFLSLSLLRLSAPHLWC